MFPSYGYLKVVGMIRCTSFQIFIYMSDTMLELGSRKLFRVYCSGYLPAIWSVFCVVCVPADQLSAPSQRFKMDDLFGDLPPPCNNLKNSSHFPIVVIFITTFCCSFISLQQVEVTAWENCTMTFQPQKTVEKTKENSTLQIKMTMKYQQKDP